MTSFRRDVQTVLLIICLLVVIARCSTVQKCGEGLSHFVGGYMWCVRE